MFADDIIQAARDRTGNKADVAVGEQYVPDEAIIAGIREAIVEANTAFGQSSARKDVTFTAVRGPTLQSPGAPMLAADYSAGILPAGTYNYRLTALLGNGETTVGPEGVAVTLSATGQVQLTWAPVPGATGYNVYGRTTGGELQLVSTAVNGWVDAGIAVPGSGQPTMNSTGGFGCYQQDYDVITYIGPDVQQIVEVIRSDAYVTDSSLFPLQVDPRTGIPFARAAFIDQAYQQDVLESISAQMRFRKADCQDWELINVGGRQIIRIMPPPTEPVLIAVRYIGVNDSIESLPEEARPAMEYAACVALLDAVLNRVNSDPSGMGENARDRRYWLELVERQRDRYESKFRAALAKRPRV